MSKTWNDIRISPIKGINLMYDSNVSYFLEETKNGTLIHVNRDRIEGGINLKDAKKLNNWLNDIFEYLEENKPKYTFQEAINHMKKGNKAKFKGLEYFLDDAKELVIGNEHDYYDATVSIDMLELQEWELIINE